MNSLQGPGRETQVVFSGSNEVCECKTVWADDVASLIWWLLAGTCLVYSPRLLADWLDVSPRDLSLRCLDLWANVVAPEMGTSHYNLPRVAYAVV
jgi:hypothetical protein